MQQAVPLTSVPLTFVETFDELAEFWRWLGERRPILAVDVETTGLHLSRDRIRLAQFGDATRGWAIPWDKYRGVVQEAIETYDGPVVGHHLKFDVGMLAKAGVRWDWSRSHDSLVMAFLTNSAGPKALKPAAGFYVDRSARGAQDELREVFGRNGWNWATVPLEHPTYWGYAAGDTMLTARLAEKLWRGIQPYRESYDLEMACARVLTDMELRGVRIDVEYCENQLGDLELQMEKLLTELPINPNSPRQVAEALGSLGVRLVKKTRAGNTSVDDDVLRAVVDSFPPERREEPVPRLAALVAEARDVQKLISAFFRNFLYYRDDDILHPHFNQLAARTGRMSVSEPALQQVPKQQLVRDAFIPREGHELVVADYDNEELRVAAHYCQDEAMIAAFAENRDLHMETARRVFGIEEPSSGQRGVGKRGMFSKAYGAGIPKFSASVGLSEEQGARVFNTIDELYPGLNRGMADVTRAVRERAREAGKSWGYVTLVDGRHLAVPTDKAYVGFNYLIQGSSAVVMKKALVDLDRVGLGEYLNLSVHDEVMLDVPKGDVADAMRVTEEMMLYDRLTVPLTASAVSLDRWGSKYAEEPVIVEAA